MLGQNLLQLWTYACPDGFASSEAFKPGFERGLFVPELLITTQDVSAEFLILINLGVKAPPIPFELRRRNSLGSIVPVYGKP